MELVDDNRKTLLDNTPKRQRYVQKQFCGENPSSARTFRFLYRAKSRNFRIDSIGFFTKFEFYGLSTTPSQSILNVPCKQDKQPIIETIQCKYKTFRKAF